VEKIDRVQMIYKFHLLDMRMAEWVDEYATEHGLEIHICQPDTANRQLAREEWRGNVLLIGANEWSDIMHAELVIKYGHGAQEERFSRNVYLHPDLDGMVEYQTVHGSADDIAENHGGRPGAVAMMESALREAPSAGRHGPGQA
jgi:hypothetical protein